MFSQGYLQLIFFYLLASCLAEEFVMEDSVIILDDNTFDVALNKYKYVLVEFYATWCQPCMQFAPEYNRLAENIKEEKISVAIAKIEGSDNKLSNQRFGVKSFPSFKLFVKGYPLDYEGLRSGTALLEFIKSTVGETLDELPTVEDIEDFLAESPVSVVFFLDSLFDKNLNIYNIVSKIYSDVAFGYTNSVYAREKYQARKNQVVLFKNFDEERNDYRGKITEKAFIRFLDENAYPTFSEFDERAEERIFKRQQSALILIANDTEQCQNQKRLLQSIAPMIKTRVQVVAVNPKDGFLTSILERLGTQSIKFPDLFYFKVQEGQTNGVTYRFKEEFTVDNILRFMYYASTGKIERNYRSQEVPQTQDGPVTLLVGETFEEIVERSGKDVFLMIYAPWDKESQKVYPTYEQLGQSLVENKNLIIGQIDGNLNELPNIKIQKFPVFKLFRAKLPSKPLDFTLDFTLEVAQSFIKNHTTFEWVQPLDTSNKAKDEKDNTENTDL